MPRDLSRYSCNDPAGEQPKKIQWGPRSDAHADHGRHLILNTDHSDGLVGGHAATVPSSSTHQR